MKPFVDKSQPIRVAVLMGGPSTEHEISLKSGENVISHLDKNKYKTRAVIIDREGKWGTEPEKLKKQTDVAFVAMHGTYGEDGTVQAILEGVDIPYTGSAALPSALAMNKFLTLQLLKDHSLITPHSILVSEINWQDMPSMIIHRIKLYLGYPVVVKPNDNGSSVATSIVQDEHGLSGALHDVFGVSREALIQPYICGREVTCGVLDQGWPDSAYALPPTEIVPKVSKFFDFRAKYDPKGSDEITPARFSDPVNKFIQKTAIRVHQVLGCRGFSRTDMICGNDRKLYILEINTIPGLTTASLIPRAAQAVGISFSSLLDNIIKAALNI